jgi:hypothetical protein
LLEEIDSAGLRNPEIIQGISAHIQKNLGNLPHFDRALNRLAKQSDEGFSELAQRRGNYGSRAAAGEAAAAAQSADALEALKEAHLPPKNKMMARAFEKRRIGRMAKRIKEQEFVPGPHGGLEPGVDFKARDFINQRKGGPQRALSPQAAQANLRAMGEIGIGSADEVGAVFANLREARKNLLKLVGRKGKKSGPIQVDLDGLIRKDATEAVAVAQALDNYGLALNQVDQFSGSALARRFDNIHDDIRAGLSPSASEALAKIDAMDSVELASFLGMKPNAIPEGLGPLGRDVLGMYGLGRVGNQVRARVTTGTIRDSVRKARDAARKIRPGDVAGSLLNPSSDCWLQCAILRWLSSEAWRSLSPNQ